PPALALIDRREPPGARFRVQTLFLPPAAAGEAPGSPILRFLGWRPGGETSMLARLFGWSRQALAPMASLSFGVAGLMEAPSTLLPAHALPSLHGYVAANRPGSVVPLDGMLNARYYVVAAPPAAGAPAVAPAWVRTDPRLRLVGRDAADAVWLYE